MTCCWRRPPELWERTLRRHGADIDGLIIRALVPVNLRAVEEQPKLGNEFGLVFASLPIGERNPVARLYAVHHDMEKLKHSSQAIVALWLLTAVGLLPGVVEDRAIELFTSKASVVISNVPGPRQPLYLAGARIEQQFFWVPQAGSIAVGISLLTYDGRVHFGFAADRNYRPGAARARALLRRGVREVCCYAQVMGPLGDTNPVELLPDLLARRDLWVFAIPLLRADASQTQCSIAMRAHERCYR